MFAAITAWFTAKFGAVLGAVAGFIFKHVLDWAYTKFVKKPLEQKKQHDDAVEQAKEDNKKVEALKPDSTAKEVDDAIDDELNHL